MSEIKREVKEKRKKEKKRKINREKKYRIWTNQTLTARCKK